MIIDAKEMNDLGDVRLTNNTAELTGMCEALFYTLGALEDPRGDRRMSTEALIRPGNVLWIHPDSKYAMGIAQGIITPKENQMLAKLTRHLTVQVTQKVKLRFRWTKKGNSDEWGELQGRQLG